MLLSVPVVTCLLGMTALAQRPATAPATGPGGTPPDTVFLEELTWAEARDLVRDVSSQNYHVLITLLLTPKFYH
jgi:hypothetical protein